MALTDKLIAIANAIRTKSGKTNSMTLDEMPSEIEALSIGKGTETLLKPSDYPDYVRKEAARVAELARTKIKDNSLVSICMSDSHHNPDDENNHAGAMHALMAIKSLVYLLPVDFIAHLGDVSFEGKTSGSNPVQDVTTLKTNLETIFPLVKETRQETIPLFAAIGNHDAGVYVTPDKATDLLPSTYMLNNFTKLAGSEEEGVVYGGLDDGGGGYCYRDFTKQKIRVFLLNTSENIVKNGADGIMLPTQQQWIAQQLINLNQEKGAEVSNWGFIVLCHYPLDYGGTKPVSNIFKAYVNGESISINGTTYSFAGKNQAKFIVQFHGHIHNFLVDQLYFGSIPDRINGTPQTQANQYEAYRMAIPNAQYNRENYYYGDYDTDKEGNPTKWSTDGLLWGIKLIQGERYYSSSTVDAQGNKPTLTDKRINFTKVPGTEKDVSFVVNVINPDEEMVYSFTYGVGPEMRSIGYNFDKIQYTVEFTSKDNSISSSNPSTTVYDGSEYRTFLTPIEGYKLIKDTVSIIMDNQEITDQVLNLDTGEIIIPKVTGNIKISAYTEIAAYYKVDYSQLVNIKRSSTAVEEIPNEGTPTYKATFTPANEDLLINPYLTKITMGGQVIPVELVDNKYEIEIAKVTGPIVVRIEAYKSNLWKFAENATDSNIYNNGYGYRNDYYLGGNEILPGDNYTALAPKEGYVVTGLIRYPYVREQKDLAEMPSIKIQGATIGDIEYVRAIRYYSDKSAMSVTVNNIEGGLKMTDAWNIEGDNENYILKPKPLSSSNNKIWAWHQGISSSDYIRFGLIGKGENLVINIEGITDDPVKLYNVVYSINNLTLTNMVSAIKENERYYAKLEDTTKYKLVDDPIIIMGDVDITESVWNQDTREIIIENVTGNIIITADSVEVEIPNLVKNSTEADGVTTYNNGLGYKNGWRLNSSGIETQDSGWTVTGFIPYTFNDTICLSGEVEYRASGNRICFYADDNGKPGAYLDPLIDMYPGTNASGGTSESQYKVSYNTNGDVLEVTPQACKSRSEAKYIRLGIKGDGKDVIVNM